MRNVIFVFGSNLAGRHGKGAALEAAMHWGAEYGVGEGRTGDSYALPTKDRNLRVLSLHEIQQSYVTFQKYALYNPELQFLLTPAGSGLAGYTIDEMKNFINGYKWGRNVWFSADWNLTKL